jgi:DNA-binding response OmpR family regulator
MASILIVEDDDRIREATRILLEDEGHVVAEAATGEDGLALVESGRVDCVLLDLLLPGRDGFDICRSIRANIDPDSGALSYDTAFRDENTGALGVDFNRADWPNHAGGGFYKPHSMVFVTPESVGNG